MSVSLHSSQDHVVAVGVSPSPPPA